MDLLEERGLTRADDRPDLDQAPFLDPAYFQPAAAEDSVLKRLRRRKRVLATTFLFVAALVALAYFWQTPAYRAAASIVIAPPDRMLASDGSNETQSTVGDTADLESQGLLLGSSMIVRQMLESPEAKSALLQECEARRAPSWKTSVREWIGLAPKAPCADELANLTKTVAELQSRLSIGVNGRSRVIEVTFTSPMASVAKTIADGIVATYLASERQDKLRPRDAAITWLRAEAGRVSDRLKANEQAIQTFLQSKGVVNGQRGSLASEQLTNLAQLLAQAESDRAAIAGRMRQTGGDVGGSVLDNRAITEIKQQLATVTARLAQVSANYGSAAPQVQELVQQRQSLQRLLSQETGTVARSANADYQAATDRVASLRSQLEQLKQNVRGNDDAATQAASLQRDVATDRDLYVDLTRSLNKLETDRRLVITNARLVSMAELPEKVFFPKISSFALGGLVLATTAAVLLALLRDRTDRTFRGVGNLAEDMRLRVLAYLPHVSRVGRSSDQIARRIQNSSEFQEAVRGLYAECLLLGSRGQVGRPRSILFSSAASGEGKSTTLLALALFSIAAGHRVLILECDLRRPSIGRSLSLRQQSGLTDVLRGKLPPEQAVQECRPGLDVLTGGVPTMDSTELLGGTRLKQVLSWATANYDLVLIDAPASRSLQDARILASKVDGVLYCTRWGHSDTEAVSSGIAELRAAGGRVMGLVLNQVERTHYSLYDRNTARAGEYSIAMRA